MTTDRQLASVLSEFARTMLTDFPIQAIVDRLVERIVDVLPITAAGVTLIAPGLDPSYLAASDTAALRFEELQIELGEGPCLAAHRTGAAVAVADLRTDDRFPAFGPRAVDLGLVAVFAFPLRGEVEVLGTLDLYRDSPGPLDPETMAAAQTLADVAAAYLLNARAREELAAARDRSYEQALHDPLTGLANRTLLLERLDHALLRSRRSGTTTAVLFVDLDRFKLVNDRYGHDVGDALLVAVARRLTSTLRPGDTLARMSGDEFVVVCEDVGDADEAARLAARIASALAAPDILAGYDVEVTASIGIALAGPGGDESPDRILRNADMAMYQAKRKGGARQQVLDLGEQREADAGMRLVHDLTGAVERGELRTDYQPIVEAGSGRIAGVEALVRWAHPSRGLVAAAVVVPLAEQSHLIVDIGSWVLETACRDRQHLQRTHPDEELTVSVNVSPRQLLARDFARKVRRALVSTGTDPSRLTLEVPAATFGHDRARAIVVLDDLKQLGVKIAIDHFGTGSSPLLDLSRFPIDVLKVDPGFIADLEHDQPSQAVVLKIIELAHLLGMTVVAEGVERPEQLRRLVALGCDQCQGLYLAGPLSAAALDDVVDLRFPLPD